MRVAYALSLVSILVAAGLFINFAGMFTALTPSEVGRDSSIDVKAIYAKMQAIRDERRHFSEVEEVIRSLSEAEFQALLNSIKPRLPLAPEYKCDEDMDSRLCALLKRSSANGVIEPWETCFNEPIDAGCGAAQFCNAQTGFCSLSNSPCVQQQALEAQEGVRG